jgi:hypothetical protein
MSCLPNSVASLEPSVSTSETNKKFIAHPSKKIHPIGRVNSMRTDAIAYTIEKVSQKSTRNSVT